jgi:DNA-binding CsgD family transcriptional regulator
MREAAAARVRVPRRQPRLMRLGPWRPLEIVSTGLSLCLRGNKIRFMTNYLADLVGRPLSPRERELCCLLAKGLQNKEIAWQMRISESSARQYTSRVIAKAGAKNRVEAVVKWITGQTGADDQRAILPSTSR